MERRPSGVVSRSKGKKKTVAPWVFQTIQEGMRLAVTEGTLQENLRRCDDLAAGKTGTAEYCDKYANAKNRCIPGNWPTHAWTVGYAPFENPEIAVVAFVYNGDRGLHRSRSDHPPGDGSLF